MQSSEAQRLNEPWVGPESRILGPLGGKGGSSFAYGVFMDYLVNLNLGPTLGSIQNHLKD